MPGTSPFTRAAGLSGLGRLRWLIGALAITLACAAAAPAFARPVAQPFHVRDGLVSNLTFNARSERYLLALEPPGRGDFRAVAVSDITPSGVPVLRDIDGAGRTAQAPEIAYDPRRDRYMLAWVELAQNPDSPATGVWAQLSRGDGQRVIAPFRLTDASGAPAVAFDTDHSQYLVVYADLGHVPPARILGQRMSADGTPIGEPILISDRPELVRNDGPDVAYRPATKDFIVVWTGSRADGSRAVYGQRIRANGAERGPEDFKVSGDVAGPTPPSPAIATAVSETDAVVTWSDGMAIEARRLHGRRPSLGIERNVSSPDNQPRYPSDPAVAFQPTAHEFVILWGGIGPESPTDPNSGPVSTIFGQHLSLQLRQIGPDDFPVSETVSPPPGSVPLGQFGPAVAADPSSMGYLAAWTADLTTISGHFGIYVRRLTSVNRATKLAAR